MCVTGCFQGDATQRLDDAWHFFLSEKKQGHIDGLIISAQAVLHELPRRSAKFIYNIFVGKVLREFDKLIFFTREPVQAENWPQDAVEMAIPGVKGARLAKLARVINERLRMGYDNPQPLAHDYVNMHAVLALETLHKLLRCKDDREFLSEMGEQLTQFTVTELQSTLDGHFGGSFSTATSMTTGGFEDVYKQSGVHVRRPQPDGRQLPMPRTHVQIVAFHCPQSSVPPPPDNSGDPPVAVAVPASAQPIAQVAIVESVPPPPDNSGDPPVAVAVPASAQPIAQVAIVDSAASSAPLTQSTGHATVNDEGLDHRLVRSGQADQEGSKLSESSQPDVRSDGQDRPPGGQNDDQGHDEFVEFIRKYEKIIKENIKQNNRVENKKDGHCWQGVDYADCFIKESVNWFYQNGREETWAFELLFKGPNGQRGSDLLKGIEPQQVENLRKLDKIFLYSLSRSLLENLLNKEDQYVYSINISLAILVEEGNWLSNFLGDLQVKLRQRGALARVIIELPEYNENLLEVLQVNPTTVLRILEFMNASQMNYAVDDAFSKGFLHVPVLDAMGDRVRWLKMDWTYLQDNIRHARTTIEATFARELTEKRVFIVEGIENDIYKNQLAKMLKSIGAERVAIQGHDVEEKQALSTSVSGKFPVLTEARKEEAVQPIAQVTDQPDDTSKEGKIEPFSRDGEKLFDALRERIVDTVVGSEKVMDLLFSQLSLAPVSGLPALSTRQKAEKITEELLNKTFNDIKNILLDSYKQLKKTNQRDTDLILRVARLTLPWLYVYSRINRDQLLARGDQGVLLEVLPIPAGIESMAGLIMAGINRNEPEWSDGKKRFPKGRDQLVYVRPEEGMKAEEVDEISRDLYQRIEIPAQARTPEQQRDAINKQMKHEFIEYGKRYYLLCDPAPTKPDELQLYQARLQTIQNYFPVLAIVELDGSMLGRDQELFNEIRDLLC